MQVNTTFVPEVDSWWVALNDYLASDKNVSDWRDVVTDGTFSALLSDFLFSKAGSKFQKNFHFDRELVCNEPAGNITVSS